MKTALSVPIKRTHKSLYLGLTVLGTITPWIFLSQFIAQEGVSLSRFFEQLSVNSVAIALTSDLLISCLVFFSFTFIELKRLHLSRRWLGLYIAATLGVGLSCSFPLFLYLREHALENR